MKSAGGPGGRVDGGLRLIGDIGGTNARFAVAASGRYTHVVHMEDRQHDSLPGAVRDYLRALPPGMRIDSGALAVAAPVSGDSVTLTNRSWTFSIEALRVDLTFSRLTVVNDFVGTAWAVPFLSEADRCQIGYGSGAGSGVIGVIGPGTGLGVSALVPSDDAWIVLSGEGGHATMCAATHDEERILDKLRARWPHVSAERVLSGQGIVNLYEAVCSIRGQVVDELTAAEVAQRAMLGEDAASVEAIDRFFSMLGTVAGNVALTLGATGGIYLAGGISPRHIDILERSAFRERFEAKGRLRGYLSRIPTDLILHESPALLGLANMPLT